MNGDYPLSFLDFLRKRDMGAFGGQMPSGPTMMMPSAMSNSSPNGDEGGMMGGSYLPSMAFSGNPSGTDRDIMGGGMQPMSSGMRDSNIPDATGTTGGNAGDWAKAPDAGWSKDQISGGMAAIKGIGSAINAFNGGEQKPIQAPKLDDNSGQIRQQAAQLWQQMMQKKQPRGLI